MKTTTLTMKIVVAQTDDNTHVDALSKLSDEIREEVAKRFPRDVQSYNSEFALEEDFV